MTWITGLETINRTLWLRSSVSLSPWARARVAAWAGCRPARLCRRTCMRLVALYKCYHFAFFFCYWLPIQYPTFQRDRI